MPRRNAATGETAVGTGGKRVSQVAAALLALIVVSAAIQFFDAGSYATAAIVPQTVTKDVAVTAIVNPSPPNAEAGAVLTISVAVQNLSSGTETFSVTLEDTTDSKVVNTASIALAANEKGVVVFLWDTTGASATPMPPSLPGRPHILKATATLTGDSNAANNSQTNTPGILIRPAAAPMVPMITIDSMDIPDAHYGQNLTMARPAIATVASPLTAPFIGSAQAQLTKTLERPGVATVGSPRQELFIGGAVVSYQPGRVFLNPFRHGEVRGRVKLQNRESSLGGYVQVGTEVYFLESDGRFRAAVPSGVRDIYISAPGYVPVLVRRANINPGELLTIPELTLLFGDANGDSRVDIVDLSIAASNFGATIRQLPAP